MSNPIKSTSRDYESIINDINNNASLKNTPQWYKDIMAGVGDMLNTMLDLAYNESNLSTAQSRLSVADKLELIDYYMQENQTSSGTLLFDILRTAVFPVALLKEELVANSTGTLSRPSLRFESRTNETAVATNEPCVRAGNTLVVARVYTTGELLRFTTTNTLPAPLQVSTDYYAIYDSATSIKVATSRANAYAGTFIVLTDAGVGVHTVHLFSKQVTCYQQSSVSSLVIATGDGTSFQEYDLPDLYILRETCVIVINAVTWTRVSTFRNSGAADTHYMIVFKSDGTAVLRFGGNGFGAAPGLFDINIAYATGGGINANIYELDKISTYAGSNANVTGVTNPNELTGAANPESIEIAKRIAPLLVIAQDRFVKTTDAESLVVTNYSISVVKVIRNAYGPLSAKVLIVPNGGGVPTAGMIASVQAFLIDRSILESIDVRVFAPVYIVTAVTSAVHMKTGYAYADILEYYKLGWRLLLAEQGQEIKNLYDGYGIDTTITFLNNLYSTTFGDADKPTIIKLLENFTPASFEMNLDDTDVKSLLASSITGIDYITITAPVLPLVLANDEITQVGVLTISEIP